MKLLKHDKGLQSGLGRHDLKPRGISLFAIVAYFVTRQVI